MLHVGHQPVVQFVALAEDLEQFDAGAHHGRGQRVGEEVGPRPLPQHVDDLAAARRKSAHGAAESLAQRTGQDVDLAAQIVKFRDAAPRSAQHAGRVAFVDHHQRVVLPRQAADLVQRSGIAVHREDPVGADHAEALRLRTFEAILQRLHVGIGVAVTHRLREPHAVDDRGVVQRIRDDGVLLREERFENAAVGVEAGGVENRVLRAEIIGDRTFQLLVNILAAADEPHRRHAETPFVHGPFGRFDQAFVVRKTQIVVGAEIQHGAARDFDLGTLRRGDHPFGLIQSRRLDISEFPLEIFLDFPVHRLKVLRFH